MTDVARTKPEPKPAWKAFLVTLVLFVAGPLVVPHLRAVLPVDETMLLFVPAMAACALVGWWAGGRALSAVLWVGLAFFLARNAGSTGVFANLLRGWALLLAGAFGIACLFGSSRPFFPRALAAVGGALGLGLIISLAGPVTSSRARAAIDEEFVRRNSESLALLTNAIATKDAEGRSLSDRIPTLVSMPAEAEVQLSLVTRAGQLMFPALLALESLAALALVWSAYHRLSRQRIGTPLAPLREFRFNDQLVWGLIVGLVILVLPNAAGLRGLGANLVLFFGALYAMRGLGVLAWFMSPGTFATSLVAGAVLVLVPVVNVVAILGFMTLGVTALGLGVGDTWADWRNRARSTLS